MAIFRCYVCFALSTTNLRRPSCRCCVLRADAVYQRRFAFSRRTTWRASTQLLGVDRDRLQAGDIAQHVNLVAAFLNAVTQLNLAIGRERSSRETRSAHSVPEDHAHAGVRCTRGALQRARKHGSRVRGAASHDGRRRRGRQHRPRRAPGSIPAGHGDLA